MDTCPVCSHLWDLHDESSATVLCMGGAQKSAWELAMVIPVCSCTRRRPVAGGD